MPALISRLGSHLLFAALLAQAAGSANAAPDPVVFRFATVGDSRAEPGDPTLNGQDRIWLQNTKATSRVFRELQAAKAQALFFNGDMIMGYTQDKVILNRQYAFWRGMVANLMETGTYVVPVPGNHEVQENLKVDGKSSKKARPDNEDSWRENMGDLIVDSVRWQAITGGAIGAFDPMNTPPIGGTDPIGSDQSQLTYSFDYAGNHFVVIDTDPVANDGHAPAAWLAADLAKARQRGAKHNFVFGHKPAFTYFYRPGIDLEGLDKFPDNQTAFWQTIEDFGATYFCGHEHIYHLDQPWKDKGGKALQVMVGSGGSPFSAKPGVSDKREDRMYAWAVVTIYASGKTRLDVYGFDEHYGRTKRLDSRKLY